MNTDALDKVVAAVESRKERECVAAWRAGYDFLYVIQYNGITEYPLKMAFIPSNREKWPHDPIFRVERYDLKNVSASDIERYGSHRNL